MAQAENAGSFAAIPKQCVVLPVVWILRCQEAHLIGERTWSSVVRRCAERAVKIDSKPDKDPRLAGWERWDARKRESVQQFVLGRFL